MGVSRTTLFAIAAAAAGTGATAADCRGQAVTFTYGVPSPMNATYVISDNTTFSISPPGAGAMDIAVATDVSLDMQFESAEGGVRIRAAIGSFEASMSNPLAGTQTVTGDDVSGTFEVLMSSRGQSTVISLPQLPGAAEQMSPFQSIAHDFFPRFPAGPVRPGESWADTVAWSAQINEMEGSSTTVYTYTLVGDTVVDGRTLKKIDVAGETQTEASGSEGGMEMTQNMTGTATGFVLWDTERELMAYGESDRSLEGSTSMMGMSVAMSTQGRSTVRLEY